MLTDHTLSKSPKLSSAINKLLMKKKSYPSQLLLEIKIQSSTYVQVKKNNFSIHHYFRMYLINLT